MEARGVGRLEPYRGRLEEATIYGIPVLRRPGAPAHDWFAGVQRADRYVKLNFLPMHGHPELLEGVSVELLRHKTGASVLRFTELDDDLVAEIEALLARALPGYLGEAQ